MGYGFRCGLWTFNYLLLHMILQLSITYGLKQPEGLDETPSINFNYLFINNVLLTLFLLFICLLISLVILAATVRDIAIVAISLLCVSLFQPMVRLFSWPCRSNRLLASLQVFAFNFI